MECRATREFHCWGRILVVNLLISWQWCSPLSILWTSRILVPEMMRIICLLSYVLAPSWLIISWQISWINIASKALLFFSSCFYHKFSPSWTHDNYISGFDSWQLPRPGYDSVTNSSHPSHGAGEHGNARITLETRLSTHSSQQRLSARSSAQPVSYIRPFGHLDDYKFYFKVTDSDDGLDCF